MRELDDLAAGRCHVLLSDCETFDEVEGCVVRFSTQEQEDSREWGDRIEGYRDISIQELVRHYLDKVG